jgi:peptidoglycan/LPS O-acetylase OafA/YrhL
MAGGKRMVALDVLRFLAIFLVILFHALYENSSNNALRPIGFVGVSLFFIISGYVLAKKYPKHTEFSFKWFFKRVVKIASLYYLAIIAIVALFGTQTYSGRITDILLHFVFLDPLSKSAAYSIISPAWFLTPLVGLYLFFPYLNKYSKNTALLFVLFSLMTLIRTMNGTLTSYSSLLFIGEFCFGIALAHDMKHTPLVISAMTIFVNPIMFLPYILFFLTYRLNFEYLPSGVLYFLGINVYSLFLFHEAFIKVIAGKWHIYGLNEAMALILLLFVMVLTAFLAARMQKSRQFQLIYRGEERIRKAFLKMERDAQKK